MFLGALCHCFCRLVRVFTLAFKFELMLSEEIDRIVRGVAPAGSTGTVGTGAIVGPAGRSAGRSCATVVRIVG